MSLEGKKILVGVTGGIAAYKIASFVRLLKKQGAEVRCMMTPASFDFITPLTLSTLSGSPVGTGFSDSKTGEWTNHVEWALWADVMIFAPVTASSLAKMAHGFSDNFLMATYLSAKCPVFIAPAMDLDMYQHPVTKENIGRLESFGYTIIPAENGFLASGLDGQGRMAEPEVLLQYLTDHFHRDGRFYGKKVLITAGPTHEAIDPVRFIGNHSSGKMGFALAEAATSKGAEVILVSGPTHLKTAHRQIRVVPVTSALQMLEAVQNHWEQADWGIFASAVADYRPTVAANQKIKKTEENLHIDLEKNPDILSWASANRKAQKVVGFALETQNGLDYARGKLEKKKLDAIVLNEIGEPGVGFGTDTNSVKLIFKSNKIRSFELQSKQELAFSLLNELMNNLYE
ncbi:bifunctional phosphopantothenoylcysteine decarboxylase/phosphopantothenate--cysteine ligase CoaBC [Fluviicola sp.]|jgi:phosphopantothenoylcysteine decarboxylase/phosphopantothenate--cysteine ligase|uniref:bifunctional phosphopantothenoylcysteine decarboxylase/phosphopantothenate--cysteine ligase CoaBC n=1 Tax=Fluviicola sp. TaxID=1917219 RepID=UPI002828774E|nr:bifunctional phosphopantothenoylcysteine decarboxylase/phosphopantothenate--cysteine ligase CoaBC [Fluviicola sp.]MDR0801242.1 bifunctional phosphopantothenoylcysteine decarboxylase/phosphopantothenate--cysteine ligase CoaBC [Fluviicola sp.]